MNKEKNIHNGCKIFCIYFKNTTHNKEGEENLNDIAKLGETEKIYEPDSLQKLCEVFIKIANIIETNYKLELKKKIEK